MTRILVPVSGGKDSQACLKLAVAEFGSDVVEGLFCDTKFEHPKTYNHVTWMGLLYGVKIHVVSAGSVEEKVLKHERFPDFRSRHCTDELKLRPTRDFLHDYALWGGDVEVWYGMRSAESRQRSQRYSGKNSRMLYPPHEVLPKKYPQYLGRMGVRFRLRVLDMSDDDIFELLDGEENPLYDEGFDRVGCFPCLASGKKWKDKAFDHDDFGRSQRKVIRILEEKINKSVYDGSPVCYEGCDMCAM